jgi:hypothetical protein
LFAIVLAPARSGALVLPVQAPAGASVELLGRTGPLEWRRSPEGVEVLVPMGEAGEPSPAHCVRISPEPDA